MKLGKIISAAAVLAAVSSGCARFGTPVNSFYDAGQMEKCEMTLAEANAIVTRTFLTTPTGRKPSHPGDQYIGSMVSSIKVRRHKRTNYYLVEVMAGERPFLKFYVASKADADAFSRAVWRMKKEFGQ